MLVRRRLLGLALVACCVLALSVAGSALAQTPTDDAYPSPGDLAGVTQGGNGGNGGPTATASDSGTLPFTGLELGVFALVGAGLLGTGLILHRTLRSGSQG